MSEYLRHEDNTEIQPVPRVPQESELPYTEAPGQDLYKGFEGVNPCECVPERKCRERGGKDTQREIMMFVNGSVAQSEGDRPTVCKTVLDYLYDCVLTSH